MFYTVVGLHDNNYKRLMELVVLGGGKSLDEVGKWKRQEEVESSIFSKRGVRSQTTFSSIFKKNSRENANIEIASIHK